MRTRNWLPGQRLRSLSCQQPGEREEEIDFLRTPFVRSERVPAVCHNAVISRFLSPLFLFLFYRTPIRRKGKLPGMIPIQCSTREIFGMQT